MKGGRGWGATQCSMTVKVTARPQVIIVVFFSLSFLLLFLSSCSRPFLPLSPSRLLLLGINLFIILVFLSRSILFYIISSFPFPASSSLPLFPPPLSHCLISPPPSLLFSPSSSFSSFFFPSSCSSLYPVFLLLSFFFLLCFLLLVFFFFFSCLPLLLSLLFPLLLSLFLYSLPLAIFLIFLLLLLPLVYHSCLIFSLLPSPQSDQVVHGNGLDGPVFPIDKCQCFFFLSLFSLFSVFFPTSESFEDEFSPHRHFF